MASKNYRSTIVWLLVAAIFFFVVSYAAIVFYKQREEPLYVGRTRLIASGSSVDSKKQSNSNVEELVHLAGSNAVINRYIDTLRELGVVADPHVLIQTLKIETVPQTQILQIEVASKDADEAKSAADVVAAEFQRFYRELNERSGKRSDSKIAVIDSAYVYLQKPRFPWQLLAIPSLFSLVVAIFLAGMLIGIRLKKE